jgi:hypothetical protein
MRVNMSVPGFQEMMLPVLEVSADGQEHRLRDLVEASTRPDRRMNGPCLTAVDDRGMSDAERGCIGSQPEDGIGDLLELAISLDWPLRDQPLPGPARCCR